MAANGVSVPTQIQLSGTGVTQIAGNTYKVTLSLAGTNTVSVTPAAKDIAGNAPSYTGSFNWVSYETAQATVSAATGSPITVTAVAKGEAIVECYVPAFDVDGTASTGAGKVYALLQVEVQA